MSPDFETRERILHHVRSRFYESGFSKVTLDEIAGELGMSKKTLYKFFPSKEALLRTIAHSTMASTRSEMEKIAASEKPFAEKIADVMMLVNRTVGRISRSFVVDIQRFAPDLWREIDKFRSEFIIQRLADMILKARGEGILRSDVNEIVLVHMLIHSIQSIVNPEFLARQPFTVNDAFHSIFKVIFEGALTDEARRSVRLFDKPLTTLSWDNL
jgi:AcrR family transcriptional regulator